MNRQKIEDMITDLQEVRAEITRINCASRGTIFNPAATDAVDQMMSDLKKMIE